MSNSRTSKASQAYDEIKNLFAEISGAANAATYERISVGEAYQRITEALNEIDHIVDASLSKASHQRPAEELACNHQDEDVTLPGNPHVYQGGKW